MNRQRLFLMASVLSISVLFPAISFAGWWPFASQPAQNSGSGCTVYPGGSRRCMPTQDPSQQTNVNGGTFRGAGASGSWDAAPTGQQSPGVQQDSPYVAAPRTPTYTAPRTTSPPTLRSGFSDGVGASKRDTGTPTQGARGCEPYCETDAAPGPGGTVGSAPPSNQSGQSGSETYPENETGAVAGSGEASRTSPDTVEPGSCIKAQQNAVTSCSNQGMGSKIATTAQSAAGLVSAGATTAEQNAAATEHGAEVASAGVAVASGLCNQDARTCKNVCETEAQQVANSKPATAQRYRSYGANCDKLAMNTIFDGIGALAQLGTTIMGARASQAALKANQPGPYGTGLTMCSNPETAASNPACAGYTGGAANAQLASNGVGAGKVGPATVGDEGNSPYAGNPNDTVQSKFLASGEGGGGGGGFAPPYPGGAGPGGNGKGGGGGGYQQNYALGTSGSGGGYMPGGGGFGNGYAYGPHGEKIDLSKYLPGGLLDPNKDRGPANQNNLLAAGISGANELSNFEKVTRKMNQKRVALKPGDVN